MNAINARGHRANLKRVARIEFAQRALAPRLPNHCALFNVCARHLSAQRSALSGKKKQRYLLVHPQLSATHLLRCPVQKACSFRRRATDALAAHRLIPFTKFAHGYMSTSKAFPILLVVFGGLRSRRCSWCTRRFGHRCERSRACSTWLASWLDGHADPRR